MGWPVWGVLCTLLISATHMPNHSCWDELSVCKDGMRG